MRNPLSEGENRILTPPATALVIFGASGDLTSRKLIPALYNLFHDGFLPKSFVVVGASRSKLSDEEFRKRLKVSSEKHSRQKMDEKLWVEFSKCIHYQPLDASNPQDFTKLKDRIRELTQDTQEHYSYLYYLSTSPDHFSDIAKNLRIAGLVEVPGALRRTALIVEKPFGRDTDSASSLNHALRESFDESQIFRIDHYLGKETVQNILVFRFGNGIFEPLWNRKYIDHIQISVCESIGVENRAPYFDANGILRDIVQNHVLQMLSLLCIEPPLSLSDADSIRNEKVKVLQSLKPLSAEDVALRCVRARYAGGFIGGDKVPGYREENGVDPQSDTETYVALKMEIDNWRWSGVPIYVRAGKRLPKRITELSIFFKRAPDSLFKGRQVDSLDPNILMIQVQPRESISLRINSKPPGLRLRVNPVDMDFSYRESFSSPSPEAYERLLLDSMRGDATLFTRDDEIETAWAYLAPLLKSWEEKRGSPTLEYEAGTWGPAAAAHLLRQSKHEWRLL